jgi:putative ABC transport system substrate-binding protein
MRRRDFITLLGGAAAISWPLAARAQQSPIRPLIGVLSPLSAAAGARYLGGLRSGLRDLGYVEGRNLTLVLRFGNGIPERLAPLARELVALQPDVLFAGAQSGALAVQNATRTIPIVVSTPLNPVASGFANSISRPGGNVTGTWSTGDDSLLGKRLDFLKLAVPGLARVGAVVHPNDPNDQVMIAKLPEAAGALGLGFEVIPFSDPNSLETLSAEIRRANVQGLFFGQSPSINSARQRIVTVMMGLKLPAVYTFREFPDAGGLMSYGPNLVEIYRQSARLVDRILKGTKPGDLPFEIPARYELIVNLKTAKAIGLAISDSFLLLADEVIE